MKIITCASFFGSGSSAFTNLVAEYSNVFDLTDYEFRFLHDLDGVSDLEFHLIECHNRHNSGHALKRFEKLSRFNAGTWFNPRYEPFFNNQYMKLTKEYINSLTDFVYKSWWFYDLYDKGVLYYYIKQLQNHLICMLPGKHKGIIPNELTYCSHPSEQKFLGCTRDYVSKLMHAANYKNLPYLSIDQIVPSQNLNRILRYFKDDIYVFIVDRDPRDIYTLAKFYKHWPICPSQNVNDFCEWFIYTRQSGSPETYDPAKVKRFRFEDIIYRYNDVVTEIEKMTGLKSNDHTKQFTKLNPKRSVNNTQVWKKHHIEDDITVIERRLSDYLYPFDEVEGLPIAGIPVEDNSSF